MLGSKVKLFTFTTDPDHLKGLGMETVKTLVSTLQTMTRTCGIKDQLPTSKYVRTHRTAGSSRCWSGSDSGVGLYVRVEHVRTGLPRATTMCRLEGSSD